MITATFAKHTSRLTRHSMPTAFEAEFEEATLTFEGPAAALRTITGVTFAGTTIAIDPKARRAIHEHHSDPAIVVERPGLDAFLQVFLYGVGDGGIADETLVTTDEKPWTLPVRQIVPRQAAFQSWFSDGMLTIDAREPVEIIWQTSNQGIEREISGGTVSGRHQIIPPALFGDRLGVCLSSTGDIYGGMEHKHTLFGEVGLASGRYLLSGGKMLEPRAVHTPSYRSLVVDLLSNESFDQQMTDGFSETTIIADAVKAEALRARFGSSSRPIKILTAEPLSNADRKPDILLLDPDCDQVLPTATVSFLLFADQAGDGYPQRQAKVIERLECDKNIAAIEHAWTRATKFYAADPERNQFGIGWSTSSTDRARGRIALMRAMTLDQRDFDAHRLDWAAIPMARGLNQRTD